MSHLKQLEEQVAALSGEDFAAFTAWFEEFRADAWDSQIEEDVKAGRLEHLIEEAKREAAAGRFTPL